MEEILIITSYFPPETGAASNRISHLSEGFQKRSFKVDVITPLPNYPTGKIFTAYKGKFKLTSSENSITIHRLWIYASNSKNKLLRLLAMLSYSFSLIWFFIWNKIPRTVIVQSPPLLVAFTCMLFLRSKNRNLILNVSDLWPKAGLELGALKKNLSYTILESIEHFNYRKANLILGQSEEILSHINSIYPNKPTFLYRNYPNFVIANNRQSTPVSRPIKIVYAGLLGIAQGIFKLCQKLDYSFIEFHIYGGGAEKELVEAFIANHPKLPIKFYGAISRDELHEILPSYDIAIIPLLNRIYGSVPSKIFEYAKLGLPILYFGGGEGETIIKENELGWVAEAADYNVLNSTILNIDVNDITDEFKEKIRTTADRKFNFEKQIDALVSVI